MSRYYSFRLFFYLLIALISSIGTYILISEKSYVGATFVTGLMVFCVVSIFNSINHVNRKLTYFFGSLENDDFTIHFPEREGLPSERMLNVMLNRMKDILQNTRLEVQQREKFYELIINSVSSGIVVMDKEGFVTDCNRVALKLIGLEVFTHIDQLHKVSWDLQELFRNIQPGESRRVAYTTERGRIQLLVRSSRIVLRDKPIMLLVINDIENELDEKEIDSWIRLIRVLSHEIMNSIAPVTSLSDTLLSLYREGEMPDEELKRNTMNGLQVIGETGKGLISFVESYRKFTRIPKPEKELVDLNEFIHRMVILCSMEINFSAVRLEVTIQPEGLRMYADPNLLGQVVLNLLKNAFYALRERSDGHILVSAGGGEEGSTWIKIRDNGPGIKPEVMDEIFVPFFTTKAEGSGIGLSVARQIMRVHGGNIKVNSIYGRETTFTLTL
ncbi:sensor histidine kinase [Gabonibacter chumensis]|uniref:sensor histidine kinase n=1 Tax=Gabonibacter chumensis TaxID=2972474 RepID=UPI002573A33D|nr:ATP-binding protein [Gabonibacter chumensis]MCR9013261.1 ATP-binding protein [Gabonibacter chumensis]